MADREFLQLGVLGCGAVAQAAHLPAIGRTQRVRLVALTDRVEGRLTEVARRFGAPKQYLDHRDLLADDDVQAVLIAVPDPLHVPLARQALHAGKHVLVEKPLGCNTSECNEIIQLSRAVNKKLQVGCMKRHDPGMAYAHQFVHDRVGQILSVSAIYRDTLFRSAMQDSCLDPLIGEPPPQSAESPDYKADRTRYNLWTQGAHLFDNIRFLAGEISAVRAQVASHAGQSSWHGLLEFSAGGGGHFELTCKSCGDWWEQYTVYGETGSVDVRVSLPFYHRPAQVNAFDGRTQQWSRPLGGLSNAYANQLDAFAESILEDRPTSPDAVDGLAAVQALEAVEESVRTNQRITLPSSRAPY